MPTQPPKSSIPLNFVFPVVLGLLLSLPVSSPAQGNFPRDLDLPSGLRISLFAEDAPGARHMEFDDLGNLFLSQTRPGKVIALPDTDGDGKADKAVTILDNRGGPHGLAFAKLPSGYFLYVAEEDRVIRLKRTAAPFEFGPPEVIVSGIPTGGHFTRTIKIKDGWLYLSVGSSCNVCLDDNPLRAAITRYRLDGSGGETFAGGLRNSVGIEFSPYSGELWGVNNGRDMLGDDLPREELNIIKKGKHYGWPYCHENGVADPQFGHLRKCETTEPPARTFTAHMAPLGLEFYQTGALPARFNHSLFITFHGSWNRSVPAGYKVVRVRLDEKGNILGDEDFITGWLQKNGKKLGRPVDVIRAPDGNLLISDDYRGMVYRVTEEEK